MAQLFERDFQGSGGGSTGPSKREDLADYIALIDAKDTPFTSMAPKGQDLGNIFHRWQVDQYEGATTEGFIDGKDFTTDPDTDNTATNVIGHDGGTISGTPHQSTTHGSGYEPLVMNHRRQSAELSNNAQYFRRATKISPLAAEVTTPAGERDLLAAAVAKKTVELKRDMEKTFLSNNAPAAGSATAPSKTRGMGAWVQNLSSDSTVGSSVYPAAQSTPDASCQDVVGSSDANELTEAKLQDLLESIYGETGNSRSYDFICGTKIKRFVTELTGTSTESTTVDATNQAAPGIAATQVRTFNQELGATVFRNTISVFEGDFGQLNIHVDNFMPDAFTGYVIPLEMTEIRYGILPRVKELPNSGSGEGRIVEAVASLVVKNPKGFGKVNKTGN